MPCRAANNVHANQRQLYGLLSTGSPCGSARVGIGRYGCGHGDVAADVRKSGSRYPRRLYFDGQGVGIGKRLSMRRSKGGDVTQIACRGRELACADCPVLYSGGVVGIDVVHDGCVVNERPSGRSLRLQDAVGDGLALLDADDRERRIDKDRNAVDNEFLRRDHRGYRLGGYGSILRLYALGGLRLNHLAGSVQQDGLPLFHSHIRNFDRLAGDGAHERFGACRRWLELEWFSGRIKNQLQTLRASLCCA